MDKQNFANQNIKKLGFLLFLNVPEEMQFGIDNQFWTIGPKFKGVKLIPSGSHFVYYSLKDENHMTRQGFWINIEKNNKVIIKTFDKEIQRFVPIENEQDGASYAAGVLNMDFDGNLGAYPGENH